MSEPAIRIVADRASLASSAAETIRERAEAAIAARGRFALALSGGSTPLVLFERWAEDPLTGPPWERTHLFWGDERSVPASDPESNFGNAQRAFIGRVPIQDANVHPIRIGDGEPADAARRYEVELRSFFGARPDVWPRFDLVLLGLGGDGHTASLFPGSTALGDREHLVASSWVERLQTHRVSLTLPVLNHARCVMFLVAGADKADILARVLEGQRAHDPLPAQVVRPKAGELIWLVDRAAAATLQHSD
ncbi:MAG: 6-phosphogluconolactonase [Acidobacteria bacterium]|nr:6-phosphogluconolactonase [Acidobacteriota bacterium]